MISLRITLKRLRKQKQREVIKKVKEGESKLIKSKK